MSSFEYSGHIGKLYSVHCSDCLLAMQLSTAEFLNKKDDGNSVSVKKSTKGMVDERKRKM